MQISYIHSCVVVADWIFANTALGHSSAHRNFVSCNPGVTAIYCHGNELGRRRSTVLQLAECFTSMSLCTTAHLVLHGKDGPPPLSQ